jgi:hypothetical protein
MLIALGLLLHLSRPPDRQRILLADHRPGSRSGKGSQKEERRARKGDRKGKEGVRRKAKEEKGKKEGQGRFQRQGQGQGRGQESRRGRGQGTLEGERRQGILCSFTERFNLIASANISGR